MLVIAFIATIICSCNGGNKITSEKNIDSIVEVAYITFLEDKPDESIAIMCDQLTDTEMMSNDNSLNVLARAFFKVYDPVNMIDTMYTLDGIADSYCITMSNDSKYMIASGGHTGQVKVFSLPSMTPVVTVAVTDTVYDAIISPNNKRLAISGADCNAHVFEFPSGRHELTLKGHHKAVIDVTFVGDDTLITASADHFVRGWELDKGTETWILRPHTKAVNRARVTPDHTMMITSGDDGNVQLFNLSEGGNPRYQNYSLIDMSGTPVKDAIISPDKKYFVGGTVDHNIKFYDVNSHQLLGRDDTDEPLRVIKISDDSRIVAAATVDKVYLLNPTRQEIFCIINLDTDNIKSLQFIDNRKLLVGDLHKAWIITIPTSPQLIKAVRDYRKSMRK